jgi:N-acyl-D-aspartate/D-glutamate deacylase
MLEHPRALAGLSDAGAHVGTVCDASFTTFMLTHWVRDRAEGRLPLEQAIEMMTRRNARYLGLADRGTIAPGQRADINVIDPKSAQRRCAAARPGSAGGRPPFPAEGHRLCRDLGRRAARATGWPAHGRATGSTRARRSLTSAS